MKKYFYLVLLAVACETTEAEREDYFPLEINKTLEYKVTETRYSAAAEPQRSVWYLKEVVGDTVGHVQGTPILRLERYRKNSLDESWKIDSVWTVYKQVEKVVRVENNIPYVKLIIPPVEGQTWNGNTLNHLPNQTYKWVSAGEKLMDVVHAADSSLIHLNKSYERYQAGVGLIFKEVRVYSYCQSNPNCIGKREIESGRDLVYELLP
ncbi:hypothetical protein Lbys_3390 [Leadbetterella byssophila DSM 17132]|uniref:Uncharacterized protein n=1 Tax=Leadbetterella byssophila (strain DSM 17132 / JCM 16389 / KACC 11308 / NBRC 106382 / 4M15) TaxID=649349 RepID=E4RXU4_LEAB4|nr:hypothetical protein [Leadbetterella byssophila]ADQ19041.1 hypothetical protein Lbys_3390 [Leadbetterella byssophila DSM 17132]